MHTQLKLAKLAALRTQKKQAAKADKIRFIAAHIGGKPLEEFSSVDQIHLLDLARAAIAAHEAWENR